MLLLSSSRAELIIPGTRDARLWPFSSTSAINRPIGSNAVFTDHAALHRGAGFNSTSWTVPVAYDNPSDPLVDCHHIPNSGQSAPFTPTTHVFVNLPVGMTGSPPPPTASYRDGFLVALKGQMAMGFTRFERLSTNEGGASYHSEDPSDDIISGNGYKSWRGWGKGAHWIGGFSLLAGLLRKWELAEVANGQRNIFNHALMVTLSKQQLKIRPRDGNGNFTSPQDVTWTWPATWSDGNGGDYEGTIPMGALLAIPPSFNIEAQAWNDPSKALARTLQKYGAYVMGAGGTNQLLFYSELGAELPTISQMSANINAIHQQLRVVSNNGPDSVGGGGTYPSELWPIPDPTMPA